MNNSKNQPRSVIKEFAEEIKNVRTKITTNTDIIPFRNDKEIGRIRDAFKVPIEYLKFRKDNGRIASDVLTWENSKGKLSEDTSFGQANLKRFLELKDQEPTEELIKSLYKSGQDQKAVITVDGFLINGNRRKMALEKLLEKYPGNEKYKYLDVIILPGPDEDEPAATPLEIEQLENRLQYHRTGDAPYYNFDKALSIKRKIEMGMTLEEQLSDDPTYYNITPAELKRVVREFEDEYLKPLQCIDKYLEYLKREGHYSTVSEGRNDKNGRWQAFLDYYKLVYKKLEDEKQRVRLGIQEDEIGKIENVAFKIIRKRDGLPKKAHFVMRDLLKLVANPSAKRELFELTKIDFELSKDEATDEQGKPYEEKMKDTIWGSKHAETVIWKVKKAYDFFDQKKEQDTPIDLLNSALEKLNHANMDVNSVELGRVDEAMKLTREIQTRANEIEHLFYDVKKRTHNLKSKYNKNKK